MPAGTWLGWRHGWPAPVTVLAALGCVALLPVAALLPTSRPDREPAAYGTGPDARRFGTVLLAGTLSATGAFAGYTYLAAFLREVSGYPPGAVSILFLAFGAACLAGVSITGLLLDRFPQAALTTAVGIQAVGMLGLYAVGSDPVAAVAFLALTGGALGPVFMATQHAMLHCAPGRTDLALAANSGLYNAGIAAGAALGGLVLSSADVRAAFLVGGLLTTAACAVLLAGRLLPPRRRGPPGSLVGGRTVVSPSAEESGGAAARGAADRYAAGGVPPAAIGRAGGCAAGPAADRVLS